MKELDKAGKEFLLNSIRCINDFPKPGIVFRDITTLLNNKEAFNFLIDHLAARYENVSIDFIAGIESRGFIFAAALAVRSRKKTAGARSASPMRLRTTVKDTMFCCTSMQSPPVSLSATA